MSKIFKFALFHDTFLITKQDDKAESPEILYKSCSEYDKKWKILSDLVFDLLSFFADNDPILQNITIKSWHTITAHIQNKDHWYHFVRCKIACCKTEFILHTLITENSLIPHVQEPNILYYASIWNIEQTMRKTANNLEIELQIDDENEHLVKHCTVINYSINSIERMHNLCNIQVGEFYNKFLLPIISTKITSFNHDFENL